MPRRTLPELTPGTVVRIPDLGPVTVRTRLGRGSFGAVYEVLDGDGTPRAMKVEAEAAPGEFSQLAYEHRVYRLVRGLPYVPRVYGFSKRPGLPTYLVMDLLGRNLEEIVKNAPGERLPLRYVCIVGVRVLDRLRDLHDAGLLHRAVKPQNFLRSRDAGSNTSDVWAVDFGLDGATTGKPRAA